jgi:2-oxoglutarate dehydrogenase E2 component (dihydrolipoamide succinyltransferase)
MKLEIKVPAMGESITEAKIGKILKSTGSKVAADDEVLELETDKVNQVLYAPQAGVITLSISTDQVVKIGQVIGYVDAEAAAAPAEPDKQAVPAANKIEPKEERGSIRRGKEAFIADLGAKPKESPRETIPKPPIPKKGSNQRESRSKMSHVRRVIAARMMESKQNTAMLTTFNEVDMTHVMSLREKYKESFLKQYGAKLGFMSFFVKAVVTALHEHPLINAYIEGDEIVQREYIDIGIAVGSDRGLFVPVLRNCDTLTFSQLEIQIEEFAKKAREGKITVDELTGGGFTITNGGVYGSLLSTPLLNPPQSAILGMHKIEKRPVVINDQIVIRQMMYLALSYDHRLIDGKEAVTFLVKIKNCLEDPTSILLEV